MATGFSKTTFNNLGTAPAIDATFLNTLQDFLVAIANGGSGSVVKADLADVATDADHATDADAVSAAGVGVASIPAMASNANNYKTGGIFYCASTITNAPFYGVKNANILVAPKDSNNVTQFAMSVDGSKAIKMRQCTSGTWTSWSDVGGGGSGAVNFLMNKLSENDLSSITNTGCTVTWDTTEDLSVAGSLKIEVSSSGTGRKVEIDLSELSDAQVTELCRLSFFYKLTVGADDNVEVYILNGSDKFYFYIPFLAANSGTLTKYDSAGMVTNRTGNKLVFGFKDNSAATVYLGDALLTPRVLPQGAVISEWRSYTPQIKGVTTDPTPGAGYTLTGKYRRVGADLEFAMYFSQPVAGTSGSGIYYITLPPEFTPDWSSYPPYGLINIGTARVFYTNGSNVGLGQVVLSAGDQKIYCIFITATSSNYAPWSSVTYALGGSAGLMTLDVLATIRISGWTSSINLITETQEFSFNTQATVNTNDTTSFGYGPGGTPILSNTSNNIYYDVKTKTPINSNDFIVIELRSKLTQLWQSAESCCGATFFGLGARPHPSNSNVFYGFGFNQLDSSTIRVRQGAYASVTATPSSLTWAAMIALSDGYDRWRVRKISNANMAEAPASGIYESGQNANGYYVKYVDGTMVQWGMDAGGASPRTKTFPVPFADTNYQVFFTPHVASGTLPRLVVGLTDRAPVGYSPGSVMQYKITYNDSNTGAGELVGFYAIGKWNLSRSVTAPGTPVGASTVFAHCNNSAANVSGANQPINFDTVVEDSLSCITTGTNWKFTAPVSGLYSISGTLYNNAGDANIYLYKNGSVFNILGNSKLNIARMILSTTIRLNQGDYFDIRGDVSVTLNGASIQITRLSA